MVLSVTNLTWSVSTADHTTDHTPVHKDPESKNSELLG